MQVKKERTNLCRGSKY